jgi:hypothetical protein
MAIGIKSARPCDARSKFCSPSGQSMLSLAANMDGLARTVFPSSGLTAVRSEATSSPVSYPAD